MRTRTTAPLEDLDALAEEYAGAWAHSDPGRRSTLRDRMIESALPFAGRLARRYRNRGESVEDLEQVARLGLVKAVDRYDPERGSFTGFAVTTIVGELRRHFRDHTWDVHVPRRLQDLSLVVNQATAALHHDLRRLPTDAELAEHCGVPLDDIRDARRSAAGYSSASLSTPVGDGDAVIGDLFGEWDHDVGMVDDRVTVAGLIARMPDRERRLLTMRFYGNLSQAEIAAEMGRSQMHVSRLLSRCLFRLREAMLTDAAPRWSPDDDEGRLAVETGRVSGEVRVTVSGEVDRDNAHDLSDALLNVVRCTVAGQAVTVDLAGVPLLDAAGVAALVAVHEAARVRDVRVTVAGLRPHVRHVVVVSGLRALLPD